jgi:hypothetical protein
MSLVDELLARINSLPEHTKADLTAKVAKEMPIWFPNAGPQARAYFCPANTLLYGGQGGGGKTDLELGLAFTAHRRTLVLRRHYVNLTGIIDRALAVHGTRDGFNGSAPPRLTTKDGRLIQFSGCQHLGDEQNWMGIPFDLKCFDEATQFLEQQVRLHMGWLRTTEEGQRCRSVLATNPPLEATGDWVIGMFRPWLDLTHPKPAQHGELRWFVTTPDGFDKEVSGPELIQLDGQKLIPTSRTFIPAKLADNPYLIRTDYQAQLDALPEPIRSAVRDGNFMAARKDADFQLIPTAWVLAAQMRWKPDGFKDFSMTAMAFDPAGGGRDSAELCWRHGGWYAPLVSAQGEETADGSLAAAKIIQHRRDNAPVVVDAGGGAGHGFGGTTIMRLRDNSIEVRPFNGAGTSTSRTKDGLMRFANARAAAWWKFREELNPDQEGGSVIALPPDPELVADLTTPTYEATARGILVEDKKKIRERIGRSPGKGDAVVMCLSEGNAAVRRSLAGRNGRARPQFATVGYASMKRRRTGVEVQNRR